MYENYYNFFAFFFWCAVCVQTENETISSVFHHPRQTQVRESTESKLEIRSDKLNGVRLTCFATSKQKQRCSDRRGHTLRTDQRFDVEDDSAGPEKKKTANKRLLPFNVVGVALCC